MTVLGRNPTLVNGHPVQGRVLLAPDDQLEVPGGKFTVEAEGGGPWKQLTWIVEVQGQRFGLRQLPVVIGGGENDDLRIPNWPPNALRLSAAQGELAVEFGANGKHNREVQPEGAVLGLAHGDTVGFSGINARLYHAFGEAETTVSGSSGQAPNNVRFRFLPTGGVLDVEWSTPAWSYTVQLPELRARLVAALLKPTQPYKAGDFVPDEVLVKSIWSGQAGKGRTDLNLLLHRTRQVMLQAGINPVGLLVRPPQGGSVCFRLAAGAKVSIE